MRYQVGRFLPPPRRTISNSFSSTNLRRSFCTWRSDRFAINAIVATAGQAQCPLSANVARTARTSLALPLALLSSNTPRTWARLIIQVSLAGLPLDRHAQKSCPVSSRKLFSALRRCKSVPFRPRCGNAFLFLNACDVARGDGRK
jgi:hypothetical protein